MQLSSSLLVSREVSCKNFQKPELPVVPKHPNGRTRNFQGFTLSIEVHHQLCPCFITGITGSLRIVVSVANFQEELGPHSAHFLGILSIKVLDIQATKLGQFMRGCSSVFWASTTLAEGSAVKAPAGSSSEKLLL